MSTKDEKNKKKLVSATSEFWVRCEREGEKLSLSAQKWLVVFASQHFHKLDKEEKEK